MAGGFKIICIYFTLRKHCISFLDIVAPYPERHTMFSFYSRSKVGTQIWQMGGANVHQTQLENTVTVTLYFLSKQRFKIPLNCWTCDSAVIKLSNFQQKRSQSTAHGKCFKRRIYQKVLLYKYLYYPWVTNLHITAKIKTFCPVVFLGP